MRTPIPQRIRAALGALFDSTNWQHKISRPFEIQTIGNVHDEVSPSDRASLVSDSKKLYANLGPVKGAVDGKAMYAVGRSWLPKFEGEDKTWGTGARDWLLNEWYPLADISGNDFQTALFLLSVAVDVEADAGAMLTEYETGFPAVQLVPGMSIGSRNYKEGKPLESGEYRGLKIVDGVVVNDQGRAVAYHVMGDDPKGLDDKFVSARDLHLLKEPQYIGQLRGHPAFASSLLDLKDFRTVQGYEKAAAMIAASIGLIEWNETGLADISNPQSVLTGGGTMTETATKEMQGGTVKVYKAGTGAKLEAFMATRPGDAFERLRDHLVRSAMSGINWHYELAWDISKLGGANTRFIISSAMRTVEDRQDLLKPFARRAVGYAIAKAIKLGKLKANKDWYKWGFTMPARMTSDYGRDKEQDREDYLNGIINLSTLCAEDGRDVDQHIAERAEENAKLKAAGLPLPMTAQQTQIEVAETQAKAGQDNQPPDSTDKQSDDSAEMSAIKEVGRIAELAMAKAAAVVPFAPPAPAPAKIDGSDIQVSTAITELEKFVSDYQIVEQLNATLPNNGQ